MKSRSITVLVVILFMFAGITTNLYFVSRNSNVSTLIGGSSKSVEISSIRGNIYDCNGEKLVNRVEKNIVAAKPCTESADILKNYLSDEQYKKLLSSIGDGSPFYEITENKPKANDYVKLGKIYDRYEDNQTACHIIGYINSADNVGISGIEKSFDKLLKGDNSALKLKYSANAYNTVLQGDDIQFVDDNYSSKKGVKLTIDRNIQLICENAMKLYNVNNGACVVLDANSGEIKSLVSTPSFNPNNIADSLASENSPFINKALTAYSVGSVYKAVIAAAAISCGCDDFEWDCTGTVKVGNTNFSCSGYACHGKENLYDAFANSCNTYFIKLACKLGSKRIIDMSRNLGFGEKNVLADSIVSDSGYLPNRDDINSNGELANLSFGQGSLMATPLQIAQCYSAFVTDGRLKFAKLIKSTVDTDGNETPYEYKSTDIRAVSDENVSSIRDLIIHNFQTEKYSSAVPDYSIVSGGKTSTAQSGWIDEDGNEIFHCWFSGFADIDDKTYVVVIFKENGVSGGTDCGPVFREIVNRLVIYSRKG